MAENLRPIVLVVDDNPEIRKLVCAMLAQLGYDALAVGSGVRALAIHRILAPIDLLIADVVIAGMSGPALAEQMTNLQPGLKVLYISGYPQSRVVQKYVAERGHRLLAKPFVRDDLKARLREIMEPLVKSTAR